MAVYLDAESVNGSIMNVDLMCDILRDVEAFDTYH